MKKIIIFIITLSLFFSSLSNTFAEEWYIEKILDLNYYSEEYELNLKSIDYIYFNNLKSYNMYKNIKNIDSKFKKLLINQYRQWELEYYQINWIITNYNNFIYYTNKFFYYLKLKEQNYNYVELDKAIINSSKNMRNSFIHIKNITK